MACSTCHQQTCVCTGANAPELVGPEGETPCVPNVPSGCPAPAPCPPGGCCTLFDLTQAHGASHVYQAAGPFALPVPPACGLLVPYSTGPCTTLDPICAGPLSRTLCFDVAPGLFDVEVRVEVLNPPVGFALWGIFLPDCQSTDNPVVALSRQEFVTNSNPAVVFAERPGRQFTLKGNVAVFVPGCNPGVKILVSSGCLGDMTPDPAPFPYGLLQNIQVKLTRLSNSDLPGCLGVPPAPPPADVIACLG